MDLWTVEDASAALKSSNLELKAQVRKAKKIMKLEGRSSSNTPANDARIASNDRTVTPAHYLPPEQTTSNHMTPAQIMTLTPARSASNGMTAVLTPTQSESSIQPAHELNPTQMAPNLTTLAPGQNASNSMTTFGGTTTIDRSVCSDLTALNCLTNVSIDSPLNIDIT